MDQETLGNEKGERRGRIHGGKRRGVGREEEGS